MRENSLCATQARNCQLRHTVVLQSLCYAGFPGEVAAYLSKAENEKALLKVEGKLQSPVRDIEQVCCLGNTINCRPIGHGQPCYLPLMLPGERVGNSSSSLGTLRGQLTILLVTTSSCFFCEARRNILTKMTILRIRRKITILEDRFTMKENGHKKT